MSQTEDANSIIISIWSTAHAHTSVNEWMNQGMNEWMKEWNGATEEHDDDGKER